MKVLSIKQPYAELILSGKKDIEYRTWDTNFRGNFLIHASKKPDKNIGLDIKLENLDYGKIIGEVELVHVHDYEEKGFGWVLRNPKRIKPIEINGKLSFWEYEGTIRYISDHMGCGKYRTIKKVKKLIKGSCQYCRSKAHPERNCALADDPTECKKNMAAMGLEPIGPIKSKYAAHFVGKVNEYGK